MKNSPLKRLHYDKLYGLTTIGSSIDVLFNTSLRTCAVKFVLVIRIISLSAQTHVCCGMVCTYCVLTTNVGFPAFVDIYNHEQKVNIRDTVVEMPRIPLN